jgi:hypothetical protein
MKISAVAVAALVAIAAATAAGYGLGVLVQGRETARIQKEFDEAVIAQGEAYSKSLEDAREKEQAWQEAAHKAELENAELKKQNDVVVRNNGILAARLREQSGSFAAELKRLSAGAAASGQRLTAAATTALAECAERSTSLGGRLEEVARAHDRCELDRQLLIGSRPK